MFSQDHVSIDQSPGLRLTILLGFQHFIIMFVGTMVVPFLLVDALCAQADPMAFSQILSTIVVTSGLATLLQSSLDSCLPIFQAGSIAYLSPILIILKDPRWRCSSPVDVSNATLSGMSHATPIHQTSPVGMVQIHWYKRMCEIQGAIICASLLEIFLGCSGLLGHLLKFISPLTIAPTICLVGLALFEGCRQALGHLPRNNHLDSAVLAASPKCLDTLAAMQNNRNMRAVL